MSPSMMDLPAQTADIFEHLSRGLFISANSLDAEQSRLFQVVDTHFDALAAYFAVIRYRLERGHDYFFFAREMSRAQLDDKIERVYRYLDWLDFLHAYDPAIGPGYRLSPAQLARKCQTDRSLRRKLEALPLRGSSANLMDAARLLLKALERESFVELVQEAQETYLILNAFDYLEQLIAQIHLASD